MPRGDRTGPDGFGPMTGRGFGFCAGFNSPGFTRGGGVGRGFSRRGGFWGRGFWGRGFRHFGRFNNAPYYKPYFERPENYFAADNMESIKEEITSVEKYLKELKEMLEKKESEN